MKGVQFADVAGKRDPLCRFSGDVIDVLSKNARVENLGVRLTNFRFGGVTLLMNPKSNARQI